MPRAVRRPARAARPSRLRSLTVSAAFKSFVLDQLEELGDVTPRSMFGGVGLYHRGVFFGILARDTLYLKVGDSNRADYTRAGMKAFKPYPRSIRLDEVLRRAARDTRKPDRSRGVGRQSHRRRVRPRMNHEDTFSVAGVGRRSVHPE